LNEEIFEVEVFCYYFFYYIIIIILLVTHKIIVGIKILDKY